jgi:hypothetical protein
MNEEGGRDEKTREGHAVTDLLQQTASTAQGGRGDVRSAVVVHHGADDNVRACDGALAGDEGSRVLARVPHLGKDGEVGRHAGIGEDEAGEGGRRVDKSRAGEQLKVRLPWLVIRGVCGLVLHTDGDGHGED